MGSNSFISQGTVYPMSRIAIKINATRERNNVSEVFKASSHGLVSEKKFCYLFFNCCVYLHTELLVE